MNLADAAVYQDSLDAVDQGTFNSVQATEVDAVITGLRQYLDGLSSTVGAFKTFTAGLRIFGDRAAALQADIDGAGPLPSPRIQIYGGVVMTAQQIADQQAAIAAAQKAAQEQAGIDAAAQAAVIPSGG